MEPSEYGRFGNMGLIARIGQGPLHNFPHHLPLRKDGRRRKSNITAGTSIYQNAPFKYQTNVCTRFTTDASTRPFSDDNDDEYSTDQAHHQVTNAATPPLHPSPTTTTTTPPLHPRFTSTSRLHIQHGHTQRRSRLRSAIDRYSVQERNHSFPTLQIFFILEHLARRYDYILMMMNFEM